MPDKDITIAGNTFTPEDVEHLVSTAQEPPTEFQKEVHEEIERIQREKAARRTATS